MTLCRPSKSFVLIMLGFCPLLMGAAFVLNRIHQAPQARPMMNDGRIRNQPPPPVQGKIGQALNSIIQWKHNPWKPTPTVGTGDHFFDMAKSMAPKDQAHCRELYRLSDIWMKKLLIRHADMAVASNNVPDDQNGYLKLLAFAQGFKKTDSRSFRKLEIPKELTDFLHNKSPWPTELARTWLTRQKPLLDEIRAIGLMPQRSNLHLIGSDSLHIAALTKTCADALMVDARLAAGEGNVTGALESIRAASGIADHLSQLEIPCLYNETVNTLIRLSLLGFTFSEILPALPVEKIDPAAWEAALHPTVSSPAEYGRLLKGEYHFGMRVFILPMLSDAGDPHPLPDPEEFIDVYTEMYRRWINASASHDPKDLPHLVVVPPPSSAGLSKESRHFYEQSIDDGPSSWQKGWIRAQSIGGMFQAVFAIMKGQPVPTDPIYGLPYVWDPVTRTLSQPNDKRFDELGSKPISVPQPESK